MGKNKGKGPKGSKGPKANVFKVAGARSLKKTKAKVVNLGLKNIKQKVQDIDKQFVDINKGPKPIKQPAKGPSSKPEKKVTKEEVANAADEILKMEVKL